MDDECGCGMHHGRYYGYCGCGMHGHEQGYRRRFLTKAEKTEKLRDYAEEGTQSRRRKDKGNAELDKVKAVGVEGICQNKTISMFFPLVQ